MDLRERLIEDIFFASQFCDSMLFFFNSLCVLIQYRIALERYFTDGLYHTTIFCLAWLHRNSAATVQTNENTLPT